MKHANKYMGRNNFSMSDVHGRFNSLLRSKEYSALKSCRSLEEIVVKLNHHFSFINEDMGYEELRNKFVENVLSELNEFNLTELDYFIEYYMIGNFFNKMDGIREHIIGQFPELKTLDLCNSFDDVQKLCISNCFLKKYFRNISSYDRQKTMLVVMKNFMDGVYQNAGGYFREILESEGDRQILEMCLNGRNMENKGSFFPNATTMNGQQITALQKADDLDEIARIFKIPDVEPVEYLVKKNNSMYADSFCQYDDVACIYAYFRLKEQEIENIMWIVECMLQNAPDKMDEIIVFE
ncbi:VA0D1 [Enterospora canceri]|uniref:VA0D1 n=1 Tax=Enterospora canceri TaxID=1081671 RepID=A0A1Y1S6P7_9MICR|nr:VA0D1 [Enterospora canceri]